MEKYLLSVRTSVSLTFGQRVDIFFSWQWIFTKNLGLLKLSSELPKLLSEASVVKQMCRKTC